MSVRCLTFMSPPLSFMNSCRKEACGLWKCNMLYEGGQLIDIVKHNVSVLCLPFMSPPLSFMNSCSKDAYENTNWFMQVTIWLIWSSIMSKVFVCLYVITVVFHKQLQQRCNWKYNLIHANWHLINIVKHACLLCHQRCLSHNFFLFKP